MSFVRALICATLLSTCMSLLPDHARADPRTERAAEAVLMSTKSSSSVDIDFDKLCKSSPTTTHWPDLDETFVKNWASPCRSITASELLSLLEKSKNGGNITISGADILPDVVPREDPPLSGRDFKIRLTIENSEMNGRFYIDNSSFRSLAIRNTYFKGPFNLENISSQDFLSFQNLELEDVLDMTSAKTTSYFYISNILCKVCDIAARNLDIGGNAYISGEFDAQKFDMSYSDFKRSVIFSTVRTGPSDNDTVVFTSLDPRQSIDCSACTVEGSLAFGDYNNNDHIPTDFHSSVNFRDARINGVVELDDVWFRSYFKLDRAVLGDLLINRGAEIGELLARNATILGSFVLSEQDKVETPCLKTDSRCHAPLGVHIWALLLKGTSIGKSLDLTGLSAETWMPIFPYYSDREVSDFSKSNLDLSGVTSNSFSVCQNSSPAALEIDGFTYTAFYSEENGYNDEDKSMCDRFGVRDWRDGGWLNWLWLAKKTTEDGNPTAPFVAQPYLFQAKLLSDEGHADWANDLQTKARWDKMEDDYDRHLTVIAIFLFLLWLGASFGIGLAALIHLLCLIGFSICIGMWWLWPEARREGHKALWIAFACLERLLPIIELNKEFKDFFDGTDGTPSVLPAGKKIFFAIYSLWGWLLGFLLLAIMSGLTQGK